MTPESDRWGRLRAVFFELADLPEADQPTRLDELTSGDAELRGEVEGLLLAAREVGERFERPAELPDDLEIEAEKKKESGA